MPDEQLSPQPSTTEAPPSPPTAPDPSSAPARPDWWATLETADAKELAKHPAVSGLVGTLAERQAKKAVDKALAEREREYQAREAQREADAERKRLADLRDNAPGDYADEMRRREQNEITARMQADATNAELQRAAVEMMDDLGLSAEDVADLQGKPFQGTPLEGFRAFTKEITQRALAKNASSAVEKSMKEWQKKIEEAARAQTLAEINGNEPSPDVGAGKAPVALKGAAVLKDQKTFESLGKTDKERIANAFAAIGAR